MVESNLKITQIKLKTHNLEVSDFNEVVCFVLFFFSKKIFLYIQWSKKLCND